MSGDMPIVPSLAQQLRERVRANRTLATSQASAEPSRSQHAEEGESEAARFKRVYEDDSAWQTCSVNGKSILPQGGSILS